MIFDKTAALEKLCPDANWSVRNDVIEWHDKEKQQPSESEIQKKIDQLKQEYESLHWKRKRISEYPDLEECIHALLDKGDTLKALQAKRAEIKLKYPKPK